MPVGAPLEDGLGEGVGLLVGVGVGLLVEVGVGLLVGAALVVVGSGSGSLSRLMKMTAPTTMRTSTRTPATAATMIGSLEPFLSSGDGVSEPYWV